MKNIILIAWLAPPYFFILAAMLFGRKRECPDWLAAVMTAWLILTGLIVIAMGLRSIEKWIP